MCEAKDFSHKWWQNFIKTKCLGTRKTLLNTTNFCLSYEQSLPNFQPFFMHEWKLIKLSQYLIVFPSHFNNIFPNFFGVLHNLMRNCHISNGRPLLSAPTPPLQSPVWKGRLWGTKLHTYFLHFTASLLLLIKYSCHTWLCKAVFTHSMWVWQFSLSLIIENPNF